MTTKRTTTKKKKPASNEFKNYPLPPFIEDEQKAFYKTQMNVYSETFDINKARLLERCFSHDSYLCFELWEIIETSEKLLIEIRPKTARVWKTATLEFKILM